MHPTSELTDRRDTWSHDWMYFTVVQFQPIQSCWSTGASWPFRAIQSFEQIDSCCSTKRFFQCSSSWGRVNVRVTATNRSNPGGSVEANFDWLIYSTRPFRSQTPSTDQIAWAEGTNSASENKCVVTLEVTPLSFATDESVILPTLIQLGQEPKPKGSPMPSKYGNSIRPRSPRCIQTSKVELNDSNPNRHQTLLSWGSY